MTRYEYSLVDFAPERPILVTRSALVWRVLAAICFYVCVIGFVFVLLVAKQPSEKIESHVAMHETRSAMLGAMDSSMSRSEEYSARVADNSSISSNDVGVLGISRRLSRKRSKKRHKRPPADATLATVLRLKAVRSYVDELDRAERAARSESKDSGAPKTSSEATTGEPRLVTTRKFSGRIQTGCVGGCFR